MTISNVKMKGTKRPYLTDILRHFGMKCLNETIFSMFSKNLSKFVCISKKLYSFQALYNVNNFPLIKYRLSGFKK